MKLSDLENKLEIEFKNEDLLKEALTHRSYLNEHPSWPHPHNERLEYLGDAVLELAVTEDLFKKFMKAAEGQLTVLRAALVNYQILSKIALEMGLGRFILMSKSEMKDTGKAREVILANALEALIGAVYIDQGFKKTKDFIKRLITDDRIEEILETKSYKDPKSELQEIIQEKLRITPSYRVRGESGPAQQRIFRVGVYSNDDLIEEGSGSSKQEAETDAARKALKHYKR